MHSSVLPEGQRGSEMIHQQRLRFPSPSQFPAKSSISLSLEALCPSIFFLPSEINVPDGNLFSKKAQVQDWKFTL